MNNRTRFTDQISFRYLTIAIGLLVIIQILFTAYQIYTNFQRQIADLEDRVIRQAEFLSHVNQESVLVDDFLAMEIMMEQMSEDPDIVYGVIVDQEQRPLTRYLDRQNEVIVAAVQSLESPRLLSVVNEALSDLNVREIRRPILTEDKFLGEIWLGYSQERVQQNLIRSAVNTAIATTALSLLLGVLTFFLFKWQVGRPLQEVGELARALADGQLQERTEIKRHDEIGQLQYAFNHMADQLQETLEGLQRANELTNLTNQALKENEARTSTILNTVGDGIITIDASGQIVLVNQQVQKIWGYEIEDLVGQTLEILMPEHFREGHRSGLRRYMQTKEPHVLGQQIELEGLHKDGFIFPIDIQITETLINDEMFFTAAMRDITQRKEAEAKRQQLLLDLERSNQELKDFAYVVSHDLKTPLRGIGSLAAWLRADYVDILDDEGKEMLQLMTGRVARMESLIDGILQYSRVGRVQQEWLIIDLNQLVHEVIELVAPPETISIIVESKLPQVYAEEVRMVQLFQNLIGNAVKYMDKPIGTVSVGCAEHDSTHWKLWVKDNGPGIDEKYYEKIFLIFQTLAQQNNIESSGIGLSIVKKIVNLHGGDIWVLSEIGEGTTFFFTLPKRISHD